MNVLNCQTGEILKLKDLVHLGRAISYVPESIEPLDAEMLRSWGPLKVRARLVEIWQTLNPELERRQIAQMVDMAFPEELFPESFFEAHPINPYRPSEYLAEGKGIPSGYLLELPLRMMLAFQAVFGEGQRTLLSGVSEGQRQALYAAGDLLSEWPRRYVGLRLDPALNDLMDDGQKGDGQKGERQKGERQKGEDPRGSGQKGKDQTVAFDEGAEEKTEDPAECSRTPVFSEQNLPGQPVEFIGTDLEEGLRVRSVMLDEDPLLLDCSGSDWISECARLALIISAFVDLTTLEGWEAGTELDLALPGYDWSWLLAALYAKAMGLPLALTSVSSLWLTALPDFLRSGRFVAPNLKRLPRDGEWLTALDPSMERLIFEFSGRNVEVTKARMADLLAGQPLQMDKTAQLSWKDHFLGVSIDAASVQKRVKRLYDESDYLLDMYTVAALTGRESLNKKRSKFPILLLNSAHPALTAQSIAEAIWGRGTGKGQNRARLASMVETEAGIPPLSSHAIWRV